MRIIVDNISCQCIVGGFDNQVCENIYDALRNYLRVRPANYGQMLMAMRRRGIKGWDGFTYFINKKMEFPTGFLPMVLDYMIELQVPVTIEDKRVNVPSFKIEDWNFDSPKGPLAEHQQQLIMKSNNYIHNVSKTHTWNVYFPRGLWDAATNSRKTASAGNLLLNIDNPRAIMLVDSQDLLKQHYEYYKTVFKGKGELGYITSAKECPGSILTLAMVRTLYNRLKKSTTMQRNMHDRYNVLICDEVHGYGGREAVYVINKINAGMRIGMSGTPLSGADKIAKFRLIGMFGNILHTVTKRELMDKGFSLKPKIRICLNQSTSNAKNYDIEMAQVITESETFAEQVADIICKHRKQKILIPFFERAHGQLLYDTFCYRYPTLAHLADWVHGEDKQRDRKLQAYINNDIRIMFASTIWQQGLNINDIEVGINCLGEKAAITLNQFLGRYERVDGVSTHFIWYDFWHSGPHMEKHSRKRIAMYKAANYEDAIEFLYPNKRGKPL